MEERKRREIGVYVKETDFLTKLSRGLEIMKINDNFDVFEGLQEGECLLKIVFNGEYVTFKAVSKPKTPEATPAKVEPVKLVPIKNYSTPDVPASKEDPKPPTPIHKRRKTS